MSNRQNQHIYSPAFVELAFWSLKNTTPEDRSSLTIDEVKIFKSDATIRRFCSEERMDYVMYMLAKLGKSWTFSVEDENYDREMLEFLIRDQMDFPQKKVDITERAAEKGVCVISSREVMLYSHMLSQNCNTMAYEVSLFSQNLQGKVRPDKRLGKWEGNLEKAKEAHERFNDILLAQLNSLSYAQETLGLDEYDLRILAAFFKERNGAMKMKDVAEYTQSSGRKMYFRKNMQKLLDLGLLHSDTKDVKKVWAGTTYFIITAKGLGKLMEYQKFVYQNTFGT